MEIAHSEYRNNEVIAAFDLDERIIETVSRWAVSMRTGANKKSPKTVETYLNNIGYFVDWLKRHRIYGHLSADAALAAVTQGGVKEYLGGLVTDGLEESTIRNRDVTIKVLMDWLTTADADRVRESSTHDDGLLSNAPHKKAPEYLNEDQLIQFLLGLHNESQRCWVHLMYDVGYRRSELEQVLWKDFHEIEGWPDELGYAPIVVRGVKKRGGGVKERISIISRPMLNRVLRYHSSLEYRRHQNKWDDKSRPAFLNVHGEALTYSGIGSVLSKASKRTRMNVHPHLLRHGAAYNIMRSEHGKSLTDKLVLVKKQFGHGNVTSTEAYTRIPAILLTKLGLSADQELWYERADKVFKNTYLAAKKHKEKRGHSKRSKV